MSEREFDVVVIGAGAAGEVAAGRLGQKGFSVAIVEERLLGGECSYYACMPSKALLRPVELTAEARRVRGVTVGEIDVPVALARRDEVIHELDDSSHVPWLEERNVTIVRARGRLAGERRVRVGDDVLVARRAVVIATGSHPFVPPVPGLADARPWTNQEATTAKKAPHRLFVLGGGVVGVEMAQAWAGLGSQVTLVHRGKRLIEREEPFASEQVALRSDGLRSPRVIFTDPQVGAVGHTLAAAEQAGLRVRAVDVETGGNAGGSFIGNGAPGTARIVVDEERCVIVGATFTGAEIGESLHAATIAVIGEVPLGDLWHAVPAFPTRSELWLRLLEAYGL